MTPNPNTISIIMIGGTGVGKSQLGNRLVNKNVFKVGKTFSSETKGKQEGSGTLGNLEVRIIDTQGFFDTEEHGDDDLKTKNFIVDLFIEDKCIDGIIFVFNSTDLRKGQHYKDLIKNLKEIFGIEILKERLKIIFTHAKHGVEYDENEEENQRKEMIEFIGDGIIEKKDIIFVNTHEKLINQYMKNIKILFREFEDIKNKYGSMDNQKMEKKKKELEEEEKKKREKENEKRRMEEIEMNEGRRKLLKEQLDYIRGAISKSKRKISEIESDKEEYERKIKKAEKGIAASSVFVAFTFGLSGIGIAHCMDEKKSFEASKKRLEREKEEEEKCLKNWEDKEKKLETELEKLLFN